MFFVCVPTLFSWLAQLKFPFIYIVDSTHLSLLDWDLVLPHNCPHLAYGAFIGLLSIAVTSVVTVTLFAVWKRFVDYSSKVVNEHSTMENANLEHAECGDFSNGTQVEVDEIPSEPSLKNESIEPLEPKVLHHDLNSL